MSKLEVVKLLKTSKTFTRRKEIPISQLSIVPFCHQEQLQYTSGKKDDKDDTLLKEAIDLKM